jgi:hypothetical protein
MKSDNDDDNDNDIRSQFSIRAHEMRLSSYRFRARWLVGQQQDGENKEGGRKGRQRKGVCKAGGADSNGCIVGAQRDLLN